MALELYWGSGSPFAWRVMLTLEVKGLAYQSTLLEFSKGDHKAAGFLKLNPRGKVPLLKDDDFVLNESLAIMAYLDRKYAEPPLFGTSPQETGLIWRAIMETEAYLLSAGDKVIRPVFFGKGLDESEKIQQAAQAVRQECSASIESYRVRGGWLGNRYPPPTSACSRWFKLSCEPPTKTRQNH